MCILEVGNMSIDNVISIVISILSSSLLTLILSTFIFQPMQEKKKYIFDEKKRVYESIFGRQRRFWSLEK